VTITASSGGQSGTASVTVTAVPVATTVTVTPPATTLVAGQGTTLTATVNDMNGQPMPGASVTWASSNSAIAAVSSTGVITTSGAGTATITATSGTVSGTATITVDAGPAATVTISPKTGGSAPTTTPLQMTATAVDSFGNPIASGFAWSSSDATVATVDPTTGLVTGVATGTATITVTNGSVSDSAPVTVP
jgi:uncharacterized protein YjdB